MKGRKRRLTVTAALCAGVLLVQLGMPMNPAAGADASRTYQSGSRYNSEYVFATTRGLLGLDAPAAFKVTLVPVTLVTDVVLLPFELVAGCF